MGKLTNEDIFESQFYWMHIEDTSYLNTALTIERLHPFFSDLINYKVLEIGPGDNAINKYYNCKEYITAVANYPNDGLSILRKQDDKSLVVVSFGVIDDCILCSNKNKLMKQYLEEMVIEIKRVMNPFSIIIGLDAEKYMSVADIKAMDRWTKMGGIYFQK